MQTKECRRCLTVKPLTDFASNKSRPDGVQTWCKPCQSVYYKETGKSKKYYEKVKREDPQRLVMYQRRTRMRNRYGITEEIYQELLAAQDERCAICGERRDYRLFVDHCHKQNVVRGLLCARCNGALGWFEKHEAIIQEHRYRTLDSWPLTSRTSIRSSPLD